MSKLTALLGFGGIVFGVCVAAEPFTEEAIQRGINHTTSNDLFQLGTGVGFVDLDNDGDPDVVAVGGPGGKVAIYENDGTGNFIDRTIGSGVPALQDGSGVTAADYDNDGDQDLFLTTWLVDNALLRNDGNFTFTDVTVAAGVSDTGAGTGAAWADFNGDTWLDLYVPNRTNTLGNAAENRLYQNNKDGTFIEVAEALGVADIGAPTLLMTWLDFDRDGDADIYLGTDKGDTPQWDNRLFRNDDGQFTEITYSSGTQADVHCMGIAIGDCDLNGWPDLYVTNIPAGNKLLMNNGDETFFDATLATNTGSYEIGWACAFLDFDHDMHLDLYVSNMNAPNRLYHGTPGAAWADLASTLNVDTAETSFCFALADIENDGDLDMLVQRHAAPLALYINHEGELRNWAKFDVIGQGANQFAIGAQIEVRAGGVAQMREIHAGANHKSHNELTLHVGLANETVMDEVHVLWPGGDTRVIRDLPANATHDIYPPERLGDMNCDANIGVDDIGLFVAALTEPENYATLNPDCPIDLADVNNDGFMTVADIGAFVARVTGS